MGASERQLSERHNKALKLTREPPSQLSASVGQTRGGDDGQRNHRASGSPPAKNPSPYRRPGGGGAFGEAAKAQVCEFLRSYAGAKSSFLRQAEAATGHVEYLINTLDSIVESFVEYLKAGLADGLSVERKAQLDVVSDILEQAHALLQDGTYHPGAAAVIVGASLEEFLRTWVEGSALSLGVAKPSIDAYAKALRAADLISKQDVKDITAWAGIRNDAAHGEWDRVADPNRVRLMLEGVNLFMRQKQER